MLVPAYNARQSQSYRVLKHERQRLRKMLTQGWRNPTRASALSARATMLLHEQHAITSPRLVVTPPTATGCSSPGQCTLCRLTATECAARWPKARQPKTPVVTEVTP